MRGCLDISQGWRQPGEVKSRGDQAGGTMVDQNLSCLPKHFSSMQKGKPWPTHHTNGEVVVHDVIWDLVPVLHLLSGDDFQVPAIQHHQGALLNFLQDFCQASPFIACGA